MNLESCLWKALFVLGKIGIFIGNMLNSLQGDCRRDLQKGQAACRHLPISQTQLPMASRSQVRVRGLPFTWRTIVWDQILHGIRAWLARRTLSASSQQWFPPAQEKTRSECNMVSISNLNKISDVHRFRFYSCDVQVTPQKMLHRSNGYRQQVGVAIAIDVQINDHSATVQPWRQFIDICDPRRMRLQ